MSTSLEKFNRLRDVTFETASNPARAVKNQSVWGGVVVIIGAKGEDPKQQPMNAMYKALSYKKETDKNGAIKIKQNQGFVLSTKTLSKYL